MSISADKNCHVLEMERPYYYAKQTLVVDVVVVIDIDYLVVIASEMRPYSDCRL